MLHELLLCFTVAMKKELRLLATFAWAAEGAAGAAFRWLLRLCATVMNSDEAGAGVSPPKEALSRRWHVLRSLCCLSHHLMRCARTLEIESHQ